MPGAICFLSLSVSKDPIPRVRNAQVVFLPNGPGSVMDPHTQKVYVCLFICDPFLSPFPEPFLPGQIIQGPKL